MTRIEVSAVFSTASLCTTAVEGPPWRRRGGARLCSSAFLALTRIILLTGIVAAVANAADTLTTYNVIFNPGSDNDIFLNVVAQAPGNLKWEGYVNNTWDVNTTANWNNGTSPAVYVNNNNITFDDTAPTTAPTVSLVSAVSPVSINVNSNTNN